MNAPGNLSCSESHEYPSLSRDPGRMFSMKTSHRSKRASNTRRSSLEFLMSRQMAYLPRCTDCRPCRKRTTSSTHSHANGRPRGKHNGEGGQTFRGFLTAEDRAHAKTPELLSRLSRESSRVLSMKTSHRSISASNTRRSFSEPLVSRQMAYLPQ